MNSFLVAAAAPLRRRPSACSSTTCRRATKPALADMLERPQPLTRELLEAGGESSPTRAQHGGLRHRAERSSPTAKAIVEAVPKAFLV